MSRRVSHALVAILLVALILLGFEISPVSGENLGPSWTATTGYLSGIDLESCVTSADYSYLYCVGGLSTSGYSNAANYAQFSASGGGIGSWTSTTAYPLSVGGHACVTYAVFIYCVGGYVGGTYSKAVYFAQTSSNGVGAWSSTNSYPTNIELQSCVVNTGYIYCIGGFDGIRYNGTAYYAQLSPAGGMTSTWSATKTYPINVSSLSCVVYSGYVYCIGGQNATMGFSDVYYAPLLTSGGIGTWTKTTSYPATVNIQSCAVASGYVYCVGGYVNSSYSNSVYYAPLSSTGVGTWTQTTAYPTNIEEQSCVAFSGYLYCVGGYYNFAVNNAVYYDSISPAPTPTVTSTTTTTATTSVVSTATVTSTAVSTQTTTSTATATSISLFTVFRTSVVTTTISSISVTTATVTSTFISTGPGTTFTTTQGQVQAGPAPLALQAGSAAAGLVIGVVLAVAAPRIWRLRGRQQGQPQPEESNPAEEEEDAT